MGLMHIGWPILGRDPEEPTFNEAGQSLKIARLELDCDTRGLVSLYFSQLFL